MHEYSVVSELVASLLPQLDSYPGKVITVYLKKGEMRILSDWALKNAFEIIAQGTRLDEASLEIEEVEARIRCPECGYTGKAEYLDDPAFHFVIPVLTCPRCGAEVDVLSGRELYIDRVSIESPEPSQNGT